MKKTKIENMSKEIIYKCDGHLPNGDDCKNESHNASHWMTIESLDGSLRIKNSLPEHRLSEMNNHDDLHFCSKDCFINLFFMSEDSE